jgi:hypothetical protein
MRLTAITTALAVLALTPAAAGAATRWRTCGVRADTGDTVQVWAPTHTPCKVGNDLDRFQARHDLLSGHFKLDHVEWEGPAVLSTSTREITDWFTLGKPFWVVRLSFAFGGNQ